MPKVSVIIPTYNRENYICEAIDSILSQTYKDFEIIIVDDGSTDNTKDIIKKYENKVLYFYQANAGPGAARNRGIKEAKGELIAFLDADDVWLPDKLKSEIEVFDKSSACDLVYCNGEFIDEEGRSLKRNVCCSSGLSKTEEVSFDRILEKWDIYPSMVMVKKNILIEFGGFDEEYGFEEYILWFNIAQKYKIFYLDENLVKRKFSIQSLTHRDPRKMRNREIQFYIKANSYFPAYKAYFLKRISRSLFTLGRLEFIDKNYKEAFFDISKSILINPCIGNNFFNKKDRILRKTIKFLTPYIYLFLTLMPFLRGKISVYLKKKNLRQDPFSKW